MPYVPRPPIPSVCAHCRAAFESRHLRRRYCCTSCNVLAAQARKKAGTAPAARDFSDPASYAVPARFAAAVGPVEPVGSYFFITAKDQSEVFAHRFRSAHPVPWLNGWGEYFPRSDFALDSAGAVWLESYGHAEQRWFLADAIKEPPAD